MLAQIYRFKLDDDARQAAATSAPATFAQVVYRYHLAKWGCASLAERAIHDLFFNVRNQMSQSKRVQLFAAFNGLHEDVASFGNAEHPTRLFSEPEANGAAVSFYMHAVATLSSAHCEAEQGNDEVVVLFPASFTSKGKSENWLVPITIAKPALETIFGGMMHEGDLEQKDVFKGLLDKVDSLDHEDVYGEPNVDADELLWLAMMQWSALLGDGLKRVALFESGGDDFEGGKAASVARSKEALLSCDHLSRPRSRSGCARSRT